MKSCDERNAQPMPGADWQAAALCLPVATRSRTTLDVLMVWRLASMAREETDGYCKAPPRVDLYDTQYAGFR